MTHERPDESMYFDANACLTEQVQLDGQVVVVHYDGIPDSDITSVNGIPCTTPLRTVIDIAPETDTDELTGIVQHCLDRRLFSVEDALARLAESDMVSRPGARILYAMIASNSGYTD